MFLFLLLKCVEWGIVLQMMSTFVVLNGCFKIVKVNIILIPICQYHRNLISNLFRTTVIWKYSPPSNANLYFYIMQQARQITYI